MTKDVAALGAVAPLVAVFGFSPAGAVAFLALCGPLFVLFLMALLENAASRARRRQRPPTEAMPSVWLRRTARAFLLASFTSALALILVQMSIAFSAS